MIESHSTRRRVYLYGGALVFCFKLALIAGILWLSYKGEELRYEARSTQSLAEDDGVLKGPEPFPLSVDPQAKIIVEQPRVDAFFEEHIAPRETARAKTKGFFNRLMARLTRYGWYQNLAGAQGRTLVIQAGERKEEVVDNFGDILGWSREDRLLFEELVASSTTPLDDGIFFPGTYAVERGARPETVAKLVSDRFQTEVLERYTDAIAEVVPLKDALTLASLLEREAYDFTDMREISGVIWNRLFRGGNLQLDATLQYAKGSRPQEPWWPKVRPQDKYIDSPYNTYKNGGLPPSPIANPSLDSVLAALNPVKTECLYYFHDKNSGFHCAPTYEEHVALLKKYYGRGK